MPARLRRWVTIGGALLALASVSGTGRAQGLADDPGGSDDPTRGTPFTPCGAWARNPIVCENAKTGSPASEWDVPGSGDSTLQGFATDISVQRGTTVSFKIATDASAYRIEIYRLGWYQGLGARHVASLLPSVALPQVQPAPFTDPATGLIDAGNWGVSASWDVPLDAVSGVYLARLVRDDTGGASHIVFVVRDDVSGSALLFKTSDATWQAYNSWGGNSLYTGSATTPPAPRAHQVSYNRPFATRSASSEDFLFHAEYPMIRWLESNGYDVSYTTDLDAHRQGGPMHGHRALLAVGHDEYWSAEARAHVEAARGAGVNLAFFNGNEMYWKVRWEDSQVGERRPFGTMVCYKEGTEGELACGGKCDPLPGVWTGLWRSGCEFPGTDACDPENLVTGNIGWASSNGALSVPAEFARHRLWRNTAVATLETGSLALAPNSLGYEWDFEQLAASYPAGRVRLSRTELDGKTHHLSLYRHASGALVFGAGTVQWSWGLDGVHDGGASTPDPNMQQATINLLAEMGAQPGTLQAGFHTASATADLAPPTCAVSSPAAGDSVEVGQPTVIRGSASDLGGVVAGVEVSVDGATWAPAIGTDSWSFEWTPSSEGEVMVRVRAFDDLGNLHDPIETPIAVVPRQCPCSLWPAGQVAGPEGADPGPVEVGVRFRSDVAGAVTGVRYYRHPANVGVHVGRLWSADGTLLGGATFVNDTTTGWQEVRFPTAVAVDANTPYVASVFMPNGRYAASPGYFGAAPVVRAPLHAYQHGAGGSNGIYHYGPDGGFPNQSFGAANYWVDLVFDTTAVVDTIPPAVVATSPADGAAGVGFAPVVTATFSEILDRATVSAATVELRDASNALVPASITWNGGARQITLLPASLLSPSTTYTVTLRGGAVAPRIADRTSNALAANLVFSFTTSVPPPAPPDEGPGGPVLVIGSTINPYSRYLAEILRAEGMNAFKVTDISLVTPSVLASHDVALLGEMPLTPAQITMLGAWVQSGGNLIAMRPAAGLASLLGLTPAGGTLSEGYLLMDTESEPAAGLVDETIQYHGPADLYTADQATVIASLYSSATVGTDHPAVTLRNVGALGGQAAAFSYDLARSVVLTRQGNPAWAGQERDGAGPRRSDDLFFGAALHDPQPDWIDLGKVAIPQADEQQRLLANLILHVNRDRKPVPRFWYFPRGHKAVVVMTGDHHGSANMAPTFDIYRTLSPAGCSVPDWECVRASGYMYVGPAFTNAQAAFYESQGFEVGVHVNTGCADWTPQSLTATFDSELTAFAAAYPSVPAQSTNRTHCIAWSDWATQAKVEAAHGIRLDTNYYYWPAPWVQDRPGLFTGSGMPMRFADQDGTLIDCYQATTQMTDESSQSYPYTANVLLDRALGPLGYYGAFVANMHFDTTPHPGSDAIVASALARNVPVISSRQLLQWLDERSASTFGAMSWTGNTLTFTVGTTARNLRAMLPYMVPAGRLTSLTRDGAPLTWTREVIKGVDYAFFSATPGSYAATFTPDLAAPVISGVTVMQGADGRTVTLSWTTDEPAASGVYYGVTGGAVSRREVAAPVTSHVLTLSGLTPGTTYAYRLSSIDPSLNEGWWPAVAAPPASFTTLSAPCASDDRFADFVGGQTAGTWIANEAGGEVQLAPVFGSELEGNTSPAGWTATPWSPAGAVTLSGGSAQVDGASFGPAARFGPGSTIEFVATFAAEAFQHAGLSDDFAGTWMIFSTRNTTHTLYARTQPGIETPLPGSWIGAPHRFRIERTASQVVYSIDGTVVATHAFTGADSLRALLSDWNPGGHTLQASWLRVLPHTAFGTFTSRVFDMGANARWSIANWVATVPPGTALNLEVRRGNSPVPDNLWTSFATLAGPGAPIGAPSRYLQYRVRLLTSDPRVTPRLTSASFHCDDQHTLAVRSGGPGTVGIEPEQPVYARGTEVRLTATPQTGMEFAGWSGGIESIANPLDVTMTGDVEIEARFVPAEAPVVQLTSPNGGDRLVIGTTRTVTWTASDNGRLATVDLQLSNDGGLTWSKTIASGLAPTGSFEWVVAGTPTSGANARLRVTARDAGGLATSDASDAGFDLVQGALAVDAALPTEFALSSVGPNPTTDRLRVAFAVPSAATVTITVLDIQGREVDELARGPYAPGRHEVVWSARRGARPVEPGVYFVRFQAGGRNYTRRVAVTY